MGSALTGLVLAPPLAIITLGAYGSKVVAQTEGYQMDQQELILAPAEGNSG